MRRKEGVKNDSQFLLRKATHSKRESRLGGGGGESDSGEVQMSLIPKG